MKKIMFISLILLLTGCTSEATVDIELTDNDQNTEFVELEIVEEVSSDDGTLLELSSVEENEFGSEGALTDKEYSLEEMLIYALEDELRAKAEYIYIMEEFEVTRPFSNIMKSEENHIQMLLPLFAEYNVEVIDEDVIEHLIPFETLKETYEIGVIAEINNIAMYDKFLEEDLPDDVADVFVKLRDASYNHLEAFEKQLEKYV